MSMRPESLNISVIDAILNELFPDFKYRTYQREVIMYCLDKIFNSKAKYIIVSAPTGIGKSHIAHQVAQVYNKVVDDWFQLKNPTAVTDVEVQVGVDENGEPIRVLESRPLAPSEALFLTKTINLQEQYLRDFKDMRKLMGAANYACHTTLLPAGIAGISKYHPTCKYKIGSPSCEYNHARLEYKASKLKTLNYAFFFTGIFQYNTSHLMVCDEGHNLEEEILNLTELNFSLKDLGLVAQDYGQSLNRYDIDVTETKYDDELNTKLNDFCTQTRNAISVVLNQKEGRLKSLMVELKESFGDERRVLEKNIEKLESEITKVNSHKSKFSSVLQVTNWVTEMTLDKWLVSYNKDNDYPFYMKAITIPNSLSNRVFNSCDKVVIMSATANRIAESLRLKSDEFEYIAVPYIFPLENRPFYLVKSLPSFNNASKQESFPVYVKFLDDLIDSCGSDAKFLVHSVSYSNAEFIMENSKHKERMYIPRGKEVRELEVSKLPAGCILLSPSITEGVDLGGLDVQVFIKCPYPYLGDEWIKMKMENDAGWYDYSTLLDIIQGSGRAIRTPTDKADTFMLDPSFKRLLTRTKKYVPDWFTSTIQEL